MMIHQFSASAGDFERCCYREDGMPVTDLCFQTADAPIHQRTEPRYFHGARLTVSVSDPDFMIHIADVHWTMEDGGAWYAAWVTPHNDPRKQYRRPNLDVWTRDELGKYAIRLISGGLSQSSLRSMGIYSYNEGAPL